MAFSQNFHRWTEWVLEICSSFTVQLPIWTNGGFRTGL